jgi:hypothetical protein
MRQSKQRNARETDGKGTTTEPNIANHQTMQNHTNKDVAKLRERKKAATTITVQATESGLAHRRKTGRRIHATNRAKKS